MVDGTGLPNQSDEVHIAGSNPVTRSKKNKNMLIKEGLFIICEDDDIKTPYFSSDKEEKEKENEETIITNDVLFDCFLVGKK